MSKTYSFPKPETTAADRSWEQRWTKKFGQWQKPIRIPAAVIEADYATLEARTLAQSAGIVDLPPEPSVDLSEWLPAGATFAEDRKDEPLKGATIDWDKAMKDLPEMVAKMVLTRSPYPQLTVDAKTMDSWSKAPRYGMTATGRALTKSLMEKTAPLPKPAPREGTTVSSSYLHSVYDPESFQRTVELTVELMKPNLDGFDAIVFRGSSGAALAYPVAYLLKKPLLHVRKELGHSYSKLEGLYGAKRIAIVDDFVSSGDTLRTIMQEVVAGYAERGYAAPVLTHLFLYAERCSSSEGAVRGAVGEILEGCEIHLAYDS